MVELSLATGRKNQIRVRMKEAGHPIGRQALRRKIIANIGCVFMLAPCASFTR